MRKMKCSSNSGRLSPGDTGYSATESWVELCFTFHRRLESLHTLQRIILTDLASLAGTKGQDTGRDSPTHVLMLAEAEITYIRGIEGLSSLEASACCRFSDLSKRGKNLIGRGVPLNELAACIELAEDQHFERVVMWIGSLWDRIEYFTILPPEDEREYLTKSRHKRAKVRSILREFDVGSKDKDRPELPESILMALDERFGKFGREAALVDVYGVALDREDREWSRRAKTQYAKDKISLMVRVVKLLERHEILRRYREAAHLVNGLLCSEEYHVDDELGSAKSPGEETLRSQYYKEKRKSG